MKYLSDPPPLRKKNPRKKALGKKGEDLASIYLTKHGYRIIERNFQKRYGELDIICVKDKTLIFVEVKTRIGHVFGKPEESVTPRKLAEVTQTAAYYKMLHPELPDSLRVDVVGIELDFDETCIYFNHIQNVTL
ncbi:YraN family protein [Candidatus Gottesmanbacteria bacterium]|nr:YraN family protein [Candidatus Gottesmanbacteria bacterium]